MADRGGIKRKALSVTDKLNILKMYDEKSVNKNQKEIAKEMDLPVSTLRTILANKSKIESSAMTGSCKRQKIKHGKFDELEHILLEWFNQARTLNLPVNGNIVTEKAHEIAKRLNIDEFSGSGGWIDRFKKRHGIVYRQICGEAESVNDADIAAWSENILPNILKEYSSNDIFNADEFGLFFKLMPDKSLVFKREKCHGGKLSKERLSVLACTNATGSQKLRLLVIGKSKAPRCFKNVRTFPCDYVSQNRAWMTGDIFINWIKQLDLSFKKQNRNILLFVDNCPAHPTNIPLENIKLVFLPPNATAKLQPLDQGIIKVLKQKYRKKLVLRYLKEMESKNSAKKLDVLDALHYVSAAWDEITADVIKNCFRKAKFVEGDYSAVEKSCEDFQELEEFPGYAEIDEDVATSNIRSIDQIITDKIAPADVTSIDEESEDEEEDDTTPILPVVNALDYVNELRRLVASFDDADESLNHLNKIENFLYSKNIKNMKQRKIDDFLK
ncbi:hypothetical protein AGLY_012473 [Aphis glycines]|uniref:HTH CENPB-type domain-containing protein n=1 Tax=Aphis glycines TaxID=307491 RepID=A0A6G0TCB5_APHGL|nr:hypothetical protein AGLY_012473 [Aphis glycines]